jgi:hypothetical protein
VAIYSEVAFGGDAISIKLHYRHAGRISIVKDVVGMPVQGRRGGGLSMGWGRDGRRYAQAHEECAGGNNET